MMENDISGVPTFSKEEQILINCVYGREIEEPQKARNLPECSGGDSKGEKNFVSCNNPQ